MTFKEYLATRRVTDTPAGDFTKNARSDPHMADVASWSQLRSYVDRRADFVIRHAVVDAARQVWLGYQLARRKDL